MKKIVSKLIDFGMGFEYEHMGSEGEKVKSFDLGLEVVVQHGDIHFSWTDVRQVLPESEINIDKIVNLVNVACIEETV